MRFISSGDLSQTFSFKHWHFKGVFIFLKCLTYLTVLKLLFFEFFKISITICILRLLANCVTDLLMALDVILALTDVYCTVVLSLIAALSVYFCVQTPPLSDPKSNPPPFSFWTWDQTTAEFERRSKRSGQLLNSKHLCSTHKLELE